MKRTRSISFVFATVIGLATGFAGGLPQTSVADDTEIYVGGAALREGIRPNVMFILDTSGSMSATVTGTGMDRLDNMKVAMKKILDGATNINVGLMRFSDPGGPVLFPISYIDEDVNVIEGTTDTTDLDVNVQVDQGTDDAEEVKNFFLGVDIEDTEDLTAAWDSTPGIMNLTSPVLDVYELQKAASAGGTDLVYRIENGADDAEENTIDGSVLVAGQRLGLSYDGSQQAIGLRFPTVEIPPGAAILSAELAFVAKEDRSGTGFTLEITGQNSTNPIPFTTATKDVTNRPRTTAKVTWADPEAWVVGATDRYTTPDIKNIVQELVSQGGWASGNPMAFIIEHAAGSVGSDAKSRKGQTYEANVTDAPWLRITYTTELTPAAFQTVGLRFNNVGVPQGAKIERAYLEFRPDTATSGNTSVQIFGHDVGDAPTFSAVDNDISKRYTFARTSTKMDWDVPVWTPGTASQSPDIKDIVQEIVDRGDWCGNNSMAFMIRPKMSDFLNGKRGPRIADSFDSDPTNAPVLRIEYDETSVLSTACMDQWVTRQIEGIANDAEEVKSNGTIDLTSTDLDFDKQKISGMRFLDIPVARNQTILEARLVFTADTTQTGTTDLTLHGEYRADATAFADVKNNISTRLKTAASVNWGPIDQVAGTEYTSPDIKAIVQEIVNHPSWQPGNALVLLEDYVSGAARREKTFDADPVRAPKLLLRVQGVLATAGGGQNSVRNVLKETIDNLDHIGHTPVVDTLLEAARYYRGDNVMYGKARGWERDLKYIHPDHPESGQILNPKPNASSTNNNVRKNTRVSHPSSWTGGTVKRNGACDEDNLGHDDCRAEYIDGNAVYESPITSNCQSNYIILLTDGIANHNHSEQAIKDYVGIPSCSGGQGEKSCGHELVKWLHDTDQMSSMAGDQHVFTYTIGFNFSDKWLVEMAALGGGSFHEASDSDDLVREITQIFTDIMNRSTSFAAPTLSVNAFNKLFHRSDVYFSLFKPSMSVSWEGNLKKYQLCESSADGCDLGEVLDANGDPAIEKDVTSENLGRITDTALSFWSAGIDGSEIKVGGAGLEIPAPASRKLFTYTATTAPNYVALDVQDHIIATKLDKGILNLDGGSPAVRRTRTQELLGDYSYLSTDDDREELFDWMLGEDIFGLEDVPSLSADGRRFAFHDPLHSSAIAVTFGGTEADPVIKLFVGTNDGGLRAINATNGIEEWVFYPQATMLNQQRLKDNFAGKHIYGLDGNPTVWLNDRNGNGVIEPGSDADGDGIIEEDEGDFVRIYIGMRRGGRNLYAVDVTPSAALTTSDKDAIDSIPPTYMWRIEGGTGSYLGLGQTWSTPKLADIVLGTDTAGQTVVKKALIFAGGYDSLQDGGFGPGGDGNGIYFVDPYDGSLMFVVSGRDHLVSNQLIVSGMDYPIPSDLALMDSTGDGAADRIMVGDTGGNMWRVDIKPNLAANEAGLAPVVGKLASVSNNFDPTDKRKFFYPPDVVRVTDGAYSSSGEYDLVVAVTGNRSHPLDQVVQDRVFAFRDTTLSPMTDNDGDGLPDMIDTDGDSVPDADGYPTIQGPLVDPATTGDLLDVTDTVDFSSDPAKADLTSASGWYINFDSNGEKGLAAPVILDGQLFFTSYVPEDVINAATCSIIEGVGRLYGLDVLTGAAAQNWDGVGDDTNLTKSDRTMTLGSGIPSQAVPIFQKEGITLLIGGGGGATSVDPDIGLPRFRTYWNEEEGT
jgi:type IV pilus assembly protein PilY1